MENCLFCKIVAKKIPSAVLYEDDEMLAFKDINPAAPVHFLIIPKQHVATLSDCSDAHEPLLGRMLMRANKLAREQGCDYRAAVDGSIGSGGYKTLINTGPDGKQEVYHLHIHVIGGAHPWRVKM